jgi:preprotein translocase subunit SecY
MATGILFRSLLQSKPVHRVLFTAAVLLAYRLGCQIPIPGLDTDVLASLHVRLTIERLSLFALGVTPIFSVLLIFEFAKLIVPPLARWEVAEPGRVRRLQRAIFMTALAVTAFQAHGLIDALYGIPRLLDGPGWMFPIIATWVAATALLGWLGGQITLHGIGSGFWVLLVTPTLIKLPAMVSKSFDALRSGIVSPATLAAALAFLVVATALIATVGTGRAAGANHRVSGADFVGVWPPLLANYVGGGVTALLILALGSEDILWLYGGGFFHLVLVAALIAAFTWLQSLGTPRTRAARPVWIIALVQIFVCIGGDVLTYNTMLPFSINGPWLIIVVTVVANWLPANGTAASSA